MTDTKLDISGGRIVDDPPPQSFKAISESDTEATALQEAKALKKSMSNQNNHEEDGADEKMLSNDEKPLAEDLKIDIAEAKFSANADKQNGEAKLELAEARSAFVGMGKEELMKYANDPFWVRLRWVLFIAFWTLWVLMLAGAIWIIIQAPKCAPPTPRTWWEKGPLSYSEDVFDSEELDSLIGMKIESVIVRIRDRDTYKLPNSTEHNEIISMLEIAKKREMNVILELSPAYSDHWILYSENPKDNPKYADYYIWKDSKMRDDQSKPVPPNNWMKKNGEPAWEWRDKRQAFCYRFDQLPSLNFRNPDVVEEFKTVLKNWLAEGVAGFQLKSIPYILVDESFGDESVAMGNPGYDHTNYEFFTHTRTVNLDGIGKLLKEFRTVVKSATNEKGPLMLSEDLSNLEIFSVNDTLMIDLPRHSNVFTDENRVSTALKIYDGINNALTILGEHWPLWTYKVTNLPDNVMNILTMLLPGSILFETKEIEIDPAVLEARNMPSILFGSCHMTLLANDTVFAYQRVQQGNPGYLVACNPSDSLVIVNFTSMRNVSKEITVQLLSTNYSIPDVDTGLKVPADAFMMPPKSAAVLTYVPTN